MPSAARITGEGASVNRKSCSKPTAAQWRSSLTPLLELPSAGDCSYPGLYWEDDLLHVMYYSSHEGKSAIYYARVKVK